MSCAEKWMVGDDMEVWPKEDVKKLVWPATRMLSLSLSRSRGARGEGGAGGGRLKEGKETTPLGWRNGTLDSILDLALSFSFLILRDPRIALAHSEREHARLIDARGKFRFGLGRGSQTLF